MIGAGPTPQVYVDPSDAVHTLRILNRRSTNLRRPLTDIKNLIVAGHVKNFESGGSLFGGWPPISPETRSSRAPLVATGKLQSDLAKKSGPGKKITKNEVRVGVDTSAGQRGEGRGGVKAYGDKDVFYARFHQAGASGNRRGTLPKREVVGITDTTREKSLTIIQQYLTAKL